MITTLMAIVLLIVAGVLITIFWKYVQRLLQVLTIFLRYLWLLFPSFLFLVISGLCFWSLLQGKDLLIASLEGKWGGSVVLVAVVFWVLTTWYSSRILVYKRDNLYYCGRDYFKGVFPKAWQDRLYYKSSEATGFHLPRLLGYLCFAIIVLAYLQLSILKHPLSGTTAFWLLLGYIGLYLLLSPAFEWLGKRLVQRKHKNLLAIIYWLSFAILLLFTLKPLFSPPHHVGYGDTINLPAYRYNATTVIILLTLLQLLYLFLVATRRLVIKAETKAQQEPKGKEYIYFLWGLIRIYKPEKTFFIVFNVISLMAITIYFSGVFSINTAIAIGSLNFAILAFGILVGFFQLVSMLSINTRINFHIIFFIMVILFGITREPHYARLLTKSATNTKKVRPDLQAYFNTWLQQHRDSISVKSEYPVFFILADGGASRSGYWVASVLGLMHDSTGGKFDDHLFALSGASGGSVGNGAYFALLYNRFRGHSYTEAGQDFLKHDFLSFTLARMLGPDFFRPLLPIDLRRMKDRAGALEKVMEEGTGDTTFLQYKFREPFYSFVPDSNNRLPILCINTTRMQDGRPGVIGNIQIQDSNNTFGKRLDVLNLLPHDSDIRLSTAIVMGARFPYVNPAGRIDSAGNKSIANYFVDGGYFDNSGAGVVHEMIVGLQEIIKRRSNSDTAGRALLNKLKFYVIHITNSPTTNPKLEKVHPLKNDLLAPITTIAGSYGTQTDVNDSRLKKYLQLVYAPDATHYQRAELYSHINRDTLSFPMNWTISNYYQNKMKKQLHDPQVAGLVQWVKQKVQ
ncbi:MAG: patatin-like phospholipase family protein [Flavisolibacter sp.]|nr:patatin-like phospholipase family protein [Flavisolibacter sp.]